MIPQALLTEHVTIERFSKTSVDEYGNEEGSWQQVFSGRARLEDTAHRLFLENRFTTVISKTAYINNADVMEGDRLTWRRLYFTVTSVLERRLFADGGFMKIELERVR